jgi:hypothetical protein
MNRSDADICIVGGAGHVGLPLSLVFASKGLRVRIFDISRRALDTIGQGTMPFMEQGAHPPLDAALPSGCLEEERAADGWSERLVPFKRDVVLSKLALHALLKDLKQSGARIYGVGAPSRASTLINYVGLDDGILDCRLEVKASYKVGKYMPGTLIPVVDEARLFDDRPEYALLLSWHIADELAPKLTAKGFKGRYIAPLPAPRIL